MIWTKPMGSTNIIGIFLKNRGAGNAIVSDDEL
jgi:hypothetical protein